MLLREVIKLLDVGRVIAPLFHRNLISIVKFLHPINVRLCWVRNWLLLVWHSFSVLPGLLKEVNPPLPVDLSQFGLGEKVLVSGGVVSSDVRVWRDRSSWQHTKTVYLLAIFQHDFIRLFGLFLTPSFNLGKDWCMLGDNYRILERWLEIGIWRLILCVGCWVLVFFEQIKLCLLTILYCTDLLAVTFELFKFILGALWAEARDWKELIVAVGISS